MMEKVSIVVPVYNTVRYLDECFNSLLRQTYENIEIIVIDDGSTDGSLKVCKEYEMKNSNIIVIHKENGGLSDARNWGMKYCTGRYITFIDSDDSLDENTIMILVKMIEKYNADISLCLRKEHLLINDEVHVMNGSKMLMHILNNSCFEVWGKLYKKELLSDCTFPLNVIHEDLYVIPKIFFNCKKCVIIHKGLYIYRIRDDSIMGLIEKTNLFDINKCCVDNIEYGEEIIKNKKLKFEFHRWHYYHILWYFYEIVCNMDKFKSKLCLKNIAWFYKKTFVKYWRNPKVKTIDKIRFSFIALMPGKVRDYSVFQYKVKLEKE